MATTSPVTVTVTPHDPERHDPDGAPVGRYIADGGEVANE